MVSLRTSFVLLAAALINGAFASPVAKRDLSTITTDFEQIKADLAAVSNDLNNLQSSGFAGIQSLIADSEQLAADVQSTTGDVQATPELNENDSETFFTQEVEPAAQSLVNLLNQFAASEPTFESFVPADSTIIGDVKQDLEEFSQNVEDLLKALESVGQSNVLQAGEPLAIQLEQAFANAIAAFSN